LEQNIVRVSQHSDIIIINVTPDWTAFDYANDKPSMYKQKRTGLKTPLRKGGTRKRKLTLTLAFEINEMAKKLNYDTITI